MGDQHVEPVEALIGLGDQVLHGGWLWEVSRDGGCRSARGADLAFCLRGGIVITRVGENDRRGLAGQALHNRATDPARRAWLSNGAEMTVFD